MARAELFHGLERFDLVDATEKQAMFFVGCGPQRLVSSTQ